MSIDHILDGVIGREGGYSNDPNDAGGETMWGITARVARANGYKGAMLQMPRETALAIYRKRYVEGPGFDRIASLSAPIAEELVDTGVNMGPQTAARFLQRALNVFNRQGRDFADIAVDGEAGTGTRAALSAFLARRGGEGEKVMLAALNAQQGERYLALCEARAQNEAFAFGWFSNRVCAP